jgi:hypothetical protein
MLPAWWVGDGVLIVIVALVFFGILFFRLVLNFFLDVED